MCSSNGKQHAFKPEIRVHKAGNSYLVNVCVNCRFTEDDLPEAEFKARLDQAGVKYDTRCARCGSIHAATVTCRQHEVTTQEARQQREAARLLAEAKKTPVIMVR